MAELVESGSNIFTQFIDAAKLKINESVTRYQTRPTSTQDSVGGSIFEAIYQYARGRTDLAKERVAMAIQESRQGQEIIAEVEQQRLMQWLPIIIAVLGLLFAAGWLIRGR